LEAKDFRRKDIFRKERLHPTNKCARVRQTPNRQDIGNTTPDSNVFRT
jgi:hypothetical protein